MKLKSPYLIKPHAKVRLSQFSTSEQGPFNDEAQAESVLEKHRKKLSQLQEVFYASQAKALLIVLQGMDTAGKDGTVRHIFSGINPQGCQVASFKVPTSLEMRHDFLWRCHQQVPPKGMIGIFNRSHYEDVLSPVVHGNMDAKSSRRHMDEINAWEHMLVENDVVVLKFFLHISQHEQTKRLQARLDDPDKHWKLSPADFSERKYWPQYTEAYEEVLSHTSHKRAPWFVIPADHKWFRNVAISSIIVDALGALKLDYPKPTFDPKGISLEQETTKSASKKVKKRHNQDAVDVDADSIASGKQ